MNRETTLRKLIMRRLKSARGAVLLEFGCFAPFFVYAFMWAADFSQTLYTEQQLEIASRLLCDVEAHLKPGLRESGQGASGVHKHYKQESLVFIDIDNDTSGCPGKPGKRLVRQYLSEVLGLDEGNVYCRGYFYRQEGPLHSVMNMLSDHSLLGWSLSTLFGSSNKIIAGIDKFMKKLEDFLTFREGRYLDNIIPTDKVVATSVSVKSKPLIRGYYYNLFGSHATDQSMMLAAHENLYDDTGDNLKEGERRRHYYFMPSFDTAPQAQYTYSRCVTTVFKQWVDGGDNY